MSNIIEFPAAANDGTPPPFGNIVLAVEELDPELERRDSAFQVAATILSTTFCGTDVDALAAYTGYSTGKIATLAKRLKKNGIWFEDGFRAPWLDEKDDWATELWAYVQVGLGVMKVEGSSDGELKFALTADGIRQAKKLLGR